MTTAWTLLLTSRKFWTGTITVFAILCATLLRILNLLPADALTATIAGIASVGMSVIGSIAWEDTAKKNADAALLALRTVETVEIKASSETSSDSTT